MLLYLQVFLLSITASLCAGLDQSGEDSLLVNAIVAKNNISMAECWKIEPGFQLSNVTGTVGDKVLQLGSMANAVYIIIPDDHGKPNNGGLHNGAHSQWVFALTGGVDVTFPEAPGGFSVYAGGMFISTDVLGTSTHGHQSIWAAGSIFIQAPFPNGVAINHTVVPNHACEKAASPKKN
ncbi:small secreted protein [Mycena filopes]|nr:small secreted protein [Mycena filopes]